MDETVINRVREVMDAASMTQAAFAERIGLTPDKLSKSLKGVRRFSSLDLALIAEAGGRTVDWLLTGREPLRAAIAARTQTRSRPDRAGVDEVTRRFAAAYEVLELLERSPALPPAPAVRAESHRFTEQGRRLADDALASLRAAGVKSPADQGTDALISAFEQCFGVDVAIVELPDGTDGLAWQADSFRLVLLGRTEAWTRQRFTLAHELGHVLARDAQELLVESHVAPGRQKDLTEVRANVFASNLLLPADEVTDAFHAVSDGAGGPLAEGTLPDEAFHRLVVRFRVSPSALAARLDQLGLIGPKARNHFRGLTTEMCHLRVGALDEYQAQEARAGAERFPSRVASELFHAYLEGETTLRPLAALLGTDVDRLHDLLDPLDPADPATGPETGPTPQDEGDLVFRP
jgi:Zn-dependent peptidase ImmA (M78 family)/transcriptional regulator with XRE-family HTH domain